MGRSYGTIQKWSKLAKIYMQEKPSIADQLMVSVWSLLEDKRYDVFIVSSFLITILYFIVLNTVTIIVWCCNINILSM